MSCNQRGVEGKEEDQVSKICHNSQLIMQNQTSNNKLHVYAPDLHKVWRLSEVLNQKLPLVLGFSP